MPPLPPLITNSLLHSIRTHPHLPAHAWYFVTGVTLSILNRPEEIPKVLIHALETGSGRIPSTGDPSPSGNNTSVNANGSTEATDYLRRQNNSNAKPNHEEQLLIARKMREALVKSIAIGGLPKTINALLALRPATPAHLLDAPLTYTPTNRPAEIYDTPASRILHRGEHFFDQVYGKVTKRVMKQMDCCGTEDLGLMARLMYGYILSNSAVLTPAESSFVLIAGLVPQDVNPQLKGHLKGALNNGASVEEVRAVRSIVLRICEAAGMKRLDESGSSSWGWKDEVAKL